MNIYFKIFFSSFGIFSIVCGTWIKASCYKHSTRKSHKDLIKYSNFNFLFFTLMGLFYIYISFFNTGREFMSYLGILYLIIPSLISKKFGKIPVKSKI